MEEDYIGDGVYVSFDGYQIWLAANHHTNKVCELRRRAEPVRRNRGRTMTGFRISEGLVFDYRFTIRNDRERHDWSLIGDSGAINVWAQPAGDAAIFNEPWYGGVEVHHATRPDYLSEAASHDLCWLLLKPCWHDGSSLFFSERIGPFLPTPTCDPIGSNVTHTRVLHHLNDWFQSHLNKQGEDA